MSGHVARVIVRYASDHRGRTVPRHQGICETNGCGWSSRLWQSERLAHRSAVRHVTESRDARPDGPGGVPASTGAP